jgi:anthranilate/para-aminobenzoate synthase component I
MAARLSALPGMAFFDSAREDGSGSELSLLCAGPTDRIRGNLDDAESLLALQTAHQTLQESGSSGADCGLPHAVLAGTVDYDGTFDFALYPETLVYSHSAQQWFGNRKGKLVGGMREPANRPWSASRAPVAPRFVAATRKEDFCAWVRRAQDYIGAGDIYQVNLSHRLQAAFCESGLWPLYESLRHYSPAPYAAYVKQPHRCVLSSSPELFLKISGRSISTRPIKGTRPRRNDPLADERSAFDLLTSSKEISELVMITDLERNDLGQVCEWGSVAVRELLKLERHEQVFHLVSTVEGRLRPDIDPVAALRACFPGGSITGAPKRRAREIIAELEPHPRGLYTGAIGWWGANGESQFNIAIRTLIHERQSLHFQVGAGIVAESVPEQEWQETWDKASGILLAAERLNWDEERQRQRAWALGQGLP